MSKNFCYIICQNCTYQCADEREQIPQPESVHVSCAELEPLPRYDTYDYLKCLSTYIEKYSLSFIFLKKTVNVLHARKLIYQVLLKKIQIQRYADDYSEKYKHFEYGCKYLKLFS